MFLPKACWTLLFCVENFFESSLGFYVAVANPYWWANLLAEATNLSQGLLEDMYPIYSIITTELWDCVVLSFFDALAKHPHQSVWKKLISNWCFPQRAVGEKQGASPNAQNRHLVIVRLRVTSTDDHGRCPARLGSWWWWCWWYTQAMGRKSRTIFEVRQSALRVDAGLPFSGNTGLWKVLRKLYTLRKGLAKAENNFCALKVYSSDLKHMLADISAKAEKSIWRRGFLRIG